MRTLKTSYIIIGNGCAAMFAAFRLNSLGHEFILINPDVEFGIEDIRAFDGLDLWKAAHRKAQDLPDTFDVLQSRLRDALPAPLEQSGLIRGEHWSILSKTPVHRLVTERIERDFFKQEQKSWAASHIKLVGADLVQAKTRALGLNLSEVSQTEGAVVRKFGLWWDASKIGMYLTQFIQNKFLEKTFQNVKIEKKTGRKIVILTKEGERIHIEGEKAILIFLTGALLPKIKKLVASQKESWMTGVRKRRREQHFVWFSRPKATQMHPGKILHEKIARLELENEKEQIWLEMGRTKYRWGLDVGMGIWTTSKGPDGLERTVDEGLRLHSLPVADTRFVRSTRTFWLDWEWKRPSWKKTKHDTYWATAFEGNLFDTLELLWNPPIQ